MKNWKAVLAMLLVLCLFACSSCQPIRAEEGDEQQEEETEPPIPDSYYYPIESNAIKGWPQGPAIEAASATVMDLDSGTFLYSKNAEATQYPASITKIMTTLLLVENCDLDDEITFSEIVYDIEEGSSHCGIHPGETMTLRDAAYGIMLESANDISNGVAEYIAGSVSGFADMMNERAAEIGCVNTHFSNPHGLYRDDHYTCAYDMALIAAEAFRNPAFREITGTRIHTIPETNLVEEERYLYNHNKMLQPEEDYYKSYCVGGKNGFTTQCLNTLVIYAEKDGQRLVSVILRVNGAGKAYEESSAILEYGFENFSTVNYKRYSPKATFYDIMGLTCLGKAAGFQSDVWKRTPFSDCSICITTPDTVTAEQLGREVTKGKGNSVAVAYSYEGTPVGASYGAFSPVYAPAQLSFERTIETEAGEEQKGAEGSIQIEGLDDVLTQTAAIFDSGYTALASYAKEHTLTVLAAGGVLLVLLVIFLVVLVFRCTADYRIQRRRKQEQKERERREEEIERMTTAEIEAELRAGMEQERLRKEEQRVKEDEAGGAAEEPEDELQAAEQLIQKLEEERRGR